MFHFCITLELYKLRKCATEYFAAYDVYLQNVHLRIFKSIFKCIERTLRTFKENKHLLRKFIIYLSVFTSC